MEHHTLDNWKNGFRHDGLLYFAQRLEEMLDPATDHIFKMPVLNTALLVDEYLKNAEYVKTKVIAAECLLSIMEEVQSSFEKDIIIDKYGHIEKYSKDRIIQMLKDKSISDTKRRSLAEYLKVLLHDYNQWCKSFLFDAVQNNEYPQIIEKGIRSFVPGIVALGYSKQFIYRFAIDLFFTKSVDSISVLKTFLDRFDRKGRKYDVYIAIDSGVIQFKNILEKRLFVEFGPFPDDMCIQFDKKEYILAKMKTTSLDEYSAAKDAYEQLNIFFTYYCFLADKTKDWFFNDAKVVDSDGVAYPVPVKNLISNRKKSQDVKILAKYSDTIILELQNKKPSYNQISKALALHNAAINESNVKNIFLNLWSILEILFVSDKDKSKVSAIIGKMVPILLKDYLCYQFMSINSKIRDLEDLIDMRGIQDQFSEEDANAWPFFIAAIDKYAGPCETLCKLLDDYPLLRNRIKSLRELCSNKKNLLDVLDEHSKRVSWHISRLYRARNTIIHSGIIPDNIQELVEHLHSYTDQCIYELLNSLFFNAKLKTFSNVLVESQLQTDEILSFMKSKASLSRSELVTIMKYDYVNMSESR